MEKSSLLRLENIGVQVQSEQGPLQILRNISVNFKKGEHTAITGPSGSGKTTLMMVCTGLQSAQEGLVYFDGKPLSKNDEELTYWRQKHIGIVFQHFHLLPTNTALENVMLPLELAGTKNPKKEAQRLLEAVGLPHRLTHKPGQLSGGEQQRVALARAMARKPALLLADEPTGNLDQETGDKVISLLFQQAALFDMTLILVTHDQKIAERCIRNIHMRDGAIINE